MFEFVIVIFIAVICFTSCLVLWFKRSSFLLVVILSVATVLCFWLASLLFEAFPRKSSVKSSDAVRIIYSADLYDIEAIARDKGAIVVDDSSIFESYIVHVINSPSGDDGWYYYRKVESPYTDPGMDQYLLNWELDGRQ